MERLRKYKWDLQLHKVTNFWTPVSNAASTCWAWKEQGRIQKAVKYETTPPVEPSHTRPKKGKIPLTIRKFDQNFSNCPQFYLFLMG